MKTEGEYFPHLDGLRAVAILGVLLAHLGVATFAGGYLGVDVFFVISGFLITRLILRERAQGRFRLGRFYVRRIRRLFPAALATVLGAGALLLPVMNARDAVDFFASIPFALLSLSNVFFSRHVGYFDVEAAYKPLLHTWSLSVEEQFYLIWPSLLLMLARFKKGRLPLCVLAAAASLALAELMIDSHREAAYYLLPFRAFELLIGAIAAMTVLGRPAVAERANWTRWAALVGLVMILASFVTFDERSRTPGLASLIPCLGTALVVLYGGGGPVRPLLEHRAAVALGRMSYSLYLVHWPLLVYVNYRLAGLPSPAVKVSLIAASLVLAAASTRWVERPFRRPGDALGRSDRRFVAGCAALAAACVLGATYGKIDRLPLDQMPRWPFQVRAALAGHGPEGRPGGGMARVPLPGSPDHAEMLRIWTAHERARLLVLGDSHAGQLVSGLAQLLPPRGITVDVVHLFGCAPLFGVTQVYGPPGTRPEQETCERNKAAVRALALSDNYDAVLLAARWFWFFEPTDYGDIHLRRDYLIDAGSAEAPTVARSKAVFERQLPATLAEIVASGKRAIVWSEVPPTGHDGTRCLHLWNRPDGLSWNRCSMLSYDEQIAQAAYTDGIIRQAGRQGAQRLAVIPTDYLCAGGQCATVFNREALYYDDNHLSPLGSAKLVQEVDAKQGLTAFVLAGALARREDGAVTRSPVMARE